MLKFGDEDIEEYVLVYHMSKVKVEEPRIIKTGKPKDFGYGFYVTKIKEQAIDFANSPKFEGKGILNTYKFYPKRLHGLNNKLFNGVNWEWLQFAFECRRDVPHEYATVEGAVADDDVWNAESLMIEKAYSREEILNYVRFKKRTQQICFLTVESLNALEFLRSTEVYSSNTQRKRR